MLTTAFPSSVAPTYGVFVKERVRAIASLPGYEIKIVAPIPYFPPIRLADRWYTWSQFPRQETIDGLSVYHPRYPMVPRFGHRFQPRLMQGTVNRLVRQLATDFDFDLIDAHYVYPSGVLAARLAAATGKPFVVTGRGEDMCRFPHVPALRRQIEFSVSRASHCIAVSGEIAAAFEECGAAADNVTVIGNGVDCQRFFPRDRHTLRKRIGLPVSAKLVVSVGDLFENKGFHLLIDAVGALRHHGVDIHARIVGGSPRNGVDYRPVLEQRINSLGLGGFVELVGRRPHDELVDWYNAADVFGLFSAREGSPNVLMEALACGVPAVATNVGGIPDVLQDPRLGLLAEERTVESIANRLAEALDRNWDRNMIHDLLRRRDWAHVAGKVAAVVENTIKDHN